VHDHRPGDERHRQEQRAGQEEQTRVLAGDDPQGAADCLKRLNYFISSCHVSFNDSML
jgi:hypothetical protein